MKFRGLFIGIEKYQYIDDLDYSCRDALGLEAIFRDNFDTETVDCVTNLLLNEEANHSNVTSDLRTLQDAREDDFVFISFSGHGCEEGGAGMCLYDTYPEGQRLSDSILSFDELTDIFLGIKSKRLILMLDCCFSGGAGAKVFNPENRKRSFEPSIKALERLAGNGRLILTASRADQPAYENSRYRHGILTYHFLQALMGGSGSSENESVPVYSLLEYVTKKVIESTTAAGVVQTPTLKGEFEGEFRIPILKAGPNFFAAFPAPVTHKVSNSVSSLSPYGFSDELIEMVRRKIPNLNELQVEAVNSHGIMQDQNVLVSAPTSSGKTFIGELVALSNTLNGSRRTLFLLPLKALVNDKYNDLRSQYASFGIKIIRVTGDQIDDLPFLMKGEYDIGLLTYEKFSSLLLGSPQLLHQVGTVVVDEIQMIANDTRGMNLEFLLSCIRHRNQFGIGPQTIGLSAVLGNTGGLEQWMNASLLQKRDRPTKLTEGIIYPDGSFIYRDGVEKKENESFIQPNLDKGQYRDWMIPLVKKLANEGKQVIVFRPTTADVRNTLNYLAPHVELPRAIQTLKLLPSGDLSKDGQLLRSALESGLAFHTAHLNSDERIIIESEFRKSNSEIKVLISTSTLAMGVNTPADAVIIAKLKRDYPNNKPYSVSEYKNMSGRAGRLGYSSEGYSYIIGRTPHDSNHYWENYVRAEPEELLSQLYTESTDPRSLFLRVLAQQPKNHPSDREHILKFIEGSFGSFQQKRKSPNWEFNRSDFELYVSDCLRHRFISENQAGQILLTRLGRIAGEAGVEYASMIRIIDVAHSIRPDQITPALLISMAQLTCELDAVYFPLRGNRRFNENSIWFDALSSQGLIPEILRHFYTDVSVEREATLRAKRASSCLFWISNHPMLEIEGQLTRTQGTQDGISGNIQSVAHRTRDLVPVIFEILKEIHSTPISFNVEDLTIRLEAGVPSEGVPIASIIGSRLSRGDYFNLLKSGLLDPGKIEASSDEALLELLNNDSEKLRLLKFAAREYKKNAQGSETVALPNY